MTAASAVSRSFMYAEQLAESAANGLRQGEQAELHGRAVSEVLADSARASLAFATIGACAGLLRFCLAPRRQPGRLLACGVAGGVIGFCAGLTWHTRDLTRSMARAAWKQVSASRDEHWLETHPIDYA